jgi:hypothetical protein
VSEIRAVGITRPNHDYAGYPDGRDEYRRPDQAASDVHLIAPLFYRDNSAMPVAWQAGSMRIGGH